MKLYLGAVDSLSPQPQVGTSCHPVPMDARTCVESRWNLVEAMFLKVCVCVCGCVCVAVRVWLCALLRRQRSLCYQVIHAGDRAAAGRRVITFDSAPLDRDVVLVGQPLVRLVLQPNKPDTVVFAYLDDVAPAGQVLYVIVVCVLCRSVGVPGQGDCACSRWPRCCKQQRHRRSASCEQPTLASRHQRGKG